MENPRRFLIPAGLLALFCAAASHAAIYKWVDAQGQVHFSDHPAGKKTQQIQIHNTVTPAQRREAEKLTKSYQRLNAKDDRETALRKAKAQAQARAKAQRKRYCRELTKEVNVAIQHPLVRFKQDGTPDYLTDQQTEAYRQKLQALQQRACAGG